MKCSVNPNEYFNFLFQIRTVIKDSLSYETLAKENYVSFSQENFLSGLRQSLIYYFILKQVRL